MMYWDTSAIVPLLLPESPRDALLTLLERDPVMLVWWGTPVECTSAVARREREGALDVIEAGAALERLRDLVAAWREMLPGESIRTTAQRLLRVHPLRAADALQLAAALVLSRDRPRWPLVTCDRQLASVAELEGFDVIMPGS